MKLIPFLIAIAALALIWATNATALAGAHPWWSGKVVYIGGPIGLVLSALSLRVLGPRATLALFAVATLAMFWIANTGKAGFAASFAEDQRAGQMWFFGWIATMAGFGGALVALGHSLRRAPAES